MLAFKNNDFFQGVILPIPQHFTLLEAKLPSSDATTLDFLKVYSLQILKNYTLILQIIFKNNELNNLQ